MEQHFDSIDSNAPAPLVFNTEQESDVVEDSVQDAVSTNDQQTTKRTEQKVSLSQYESVTTGEESPTQGADFPPAENVAGQPNDSHIPVNADVTIQNASTDPKTSTPIRQILVAPRSDSVNCSPVHLTGTPTQSEIRTMSGDSSSVINRGARVKFIDPREVTVPILGYETMEQRSRFTVFKLHVQRGRADNWFVFRRYSDFTQLQRKLRILFPMFRFGLPPKRWFRDNFERVFLDDRVQGLQAFINSLICHRDVCNSIPVQQFFCFEDPPGAHDSIEESRAYCEELEDTVYGLRKELRDKESELELLRDELTLYKSQVEMLTKALRDKPSNGATNTNMNANIQNTVPSPANSLAECDILTTQTEHSLSVSVDTGSQIHSAIDTPLAQLGVSVPSLKDELLAATSKDSQFTGIHQ